MGGPADEAGTGGTGQADDPTASAIPDPEAGTDAEPAARSSSIASLRFRRFLGPVAGGIGVILLVIGALGFLSASSDHSARDTANSKRRMLHAAEVRADAARSRVLDASEALGNQIDAEVSAANDLTDAQNAIVGAFDAAVSQANNGDIGGAQAGFQAQAGAVAGLGDKVAAERRALGEAQRRLGELQAAEQGR